MENLKLRANPEMILQLAFEEAMVTNIPLQCELLLRKLVVSIYCLHSLQK